MRKGRWVVFLVSGVFFLDEKAAAYSIASLMKARNLKLIDVIQEGRRCKHRKCLSKVWIYRKVCKTIIFLQSKVRVNRKRSPTA